MNDPAPIDIFRPKGVETRPVSVMPAAGATTSDEEIEQELVLYSQYMKSRDSLIRRARAAGLTDVRIALLMGHSRNTVRSAPE